MHLCIPQHVALQLGLAENDRREITLADGSKKVIPYVGPIRVQFGNRQCFVGAMVLGVTVNPNSPNIPSAVAKGLRHC